VPEGYTALAFSRRILVSRRRREAAEAADKSKCWVPRRL
jgi:hypothetical protein